MNYIDPGTPITAIHWNDIFQSADDQLTDTMGGLSAVLAGIDKQWDRGFFFFDPVAVSPLSLHPMAAAFIFGSSPFYTTYFQSILAGQPGILAGQPGMFYRQYNHAAITALVGGLSVLATSSKFGVVKLARPTWAAWSAAVYPAGLGSIGSTGLKNTISGTDYAILNCLDVSLGVIKVSGNAVTFSDVTMAEHEQPLKPIDVFIVSDVTWDNAWDKYSVVRVHNCGWNAAVIFGTTIKSGASRCFRWQADVGWTAQGNYFHWMQSGDGRFLQMRESEISVPTEFPAVSHPGGTASLFQPGIVMDVLAVALGQSKTNYAGYFDVTKFWDLSPIYNNAGYQSLSTENSPPAGGYLAATSTASLIGDLIVHRGRVMTYQSESVHPFLDFDGFATLAADLNAIGITTRALIQTNPFGGSVSNLEIYSGGSYSLVDASCPLATFLNAAAVAAKQIGATQASTPKSVILPWIIFSALDVQSNPSTVNYTFNLWSLDGSGNPILGATQTVTVNLAGSTATTKSNVFLPTDTVATGSNWIGSTSIGGGILLFGNVTVQSTTFGPALLWDELWPLNAQFTQILDSIYSGMKVFTARVALDISSGHWLRVTRVAFLNENRTADGANLFAENVWPPRYPAASTLLWNFARTDQQCRNQRYFLHDPADSPMMPNWSSVNSGSDYDHHGYFVNDPLTGLPTYIGDDLRLNQWNTLTTFYEAAPLGLDTPTLGSIADHDELGGQIFKKSGIARCGAWTPGTDAWGPFAEWMNGGGTFTWCIAPDMTGAVNSVSLHGYNLVPKIESGDIADPDQISPNVLACQAEHFNSLASLVAAQPPMKGKYSLQGGVDFTLNFAAANIIIVDGGAGFSVGMFLNFNLKVAAVNGSGAITAVAQNGAVVVNTYHIYSTPVRPFLAGNPGGGTDAFIDTTSGDGSALSFIPVYAPVGVPLSAYMTAPAVYSASNFFPRSAFFSWNGATPGGADPVATYIASLGGSVQTTLPDSYATAILYEWGSYTSGAYTTHTTAGAYLFSPILAASAAAYRWITIANAQTIYATFSLPFALDKNYAPMSFHVVESSQDVSPLAVADDAMIASCLTPAQRGFSWDGTGYFDYRQLILWGIYGGSISYLEAADGDGYTYGIGVGPDGGANGGYQPANLWGSISGMHIYQNIPKNTITTYTDSGDFAVKAADFVSDPAGLWLCDSGLSNISAGAIVKQWGAFRKTYSIYTDTIRVTGSFDVTVGYGFPPSRTVITWEQWRHTDLLLCRDNWGVLNPVMLGTVNCPLVARAFLFYGLPDQAIAALPQNYAYKDPAFVLGRDPALLALGEQILPIFVDNLVEGSQSEIKVAHGPGDFTVTTQLANARLITCPIDGQIFAPSGIGAGGGSGGL